MKHLVKLFLYERLTSNHIFACSSPGTICFSNVLFLEKLVDPKFLLAIVTENVFGCLFLQSINRVPIHFQKTFSILFQYLFSNNLEDLIPPLIFIFRIFYSWNTMKKTSAELWSPVKNKNWINKWLNLRISILFQYFMHVLDNTFPRSWKPILQFNTFSIPRGNPELNAKPSLQN